MSGMGRASENIVWKCTFKMLASYLKKQLPNVTCVVVCVFVCRKAVVLSCNAPLVVQHVVADRQEVKHLGGPY